MALSLNVWEELSENEKNKVVNFLRNNCRIDCEEPASDKNKPKAYPINSGLTSGGFDKKFGEEYRINIHSIEGIPSFLMAELKEPGTKNRVGGSEAIKAIMHYGQFEIGSN
ncbi:hypothetical protein V6S65_06820 [Lactococcus lactis]|uniref:Uncharacterized protein n=1 Tax=Lactococcus lactis TaxID=1358 RepID=A0ABD5GRW1_9LACT|nr:hypothetical protein [Lactococcus lactis]MDV2618956.1 hypothetical protein [Lactococcus lactis]